MSPMKLVISTLGLALLLPNFGSAREGSFPIVMPYVRPKLPMKESYLCTAVQVRQKYI